MTQETLKWYEILFEYWTQIVFILGSLGVVFTALMNWKYKRDEIRYSRFQENKIIEIKDFYKSFLNLESEVKKYYYQVEFGTHSDEIFNEMRQKISDATLDLEYHLRVVRLFTNDDQIALIENLKTKVEEIRINVSKWLIARKGPNRSEVDANLSKIGETIIPIELPGLLKQLEAELKKDLK